VRRQRRFGNITASIAGCDKTLHRFCFGRLAIVLLFIIIIIKIHRIAVMLLRTKRWRGTLQCQQIQYATGALNTVPEIMNDRPR